MSLRKGAAQRLPVAHAGRQHGAQPALSWAPGSGRALRSQVKPGAAARCLGPNSRFLQMFWLTNLCSVYIMAIIYTHIGEEEIALELIQHLSAS